MKDTINPSIIRCLFLCLATGLFFSCKKQNKEVIGQSTAEETALLKTSPVAAESPASTENLQESSASLFPQNALPRASTNAIGATDFVDFDDEMALTILPDYAASTFALAPFYIQQVGNAWVHVKENNTGNYKPAFKSDYGHFHLSYQNFDPCIRSNGTFGKPVGSSCASINPVKEPRVLNTHAGDHWIKIYAYDYDNPARIFDLLGIKVTNGPIQLWFKKSNGDWLHWSSIGEGSWNLSAHCTSIKEVLISSTGNTSSIGFDNLKILMPYN